MFAALSARVPQDRDLPERVHRLECLRRVLNGTLYDGLAYSFGQERKGIDGTGEYVPIAERRPSVRYGLCRMVVEDSIALLFGEGRFPKIDCANKGVRDTLGDVVKECLLNRVMLEAALRGSVGSVVVRLRVLKGRLFFDVMDTLFLTPVWQDEAPDTLERVTELRKVKGAALREQGYDVPDDELQADWWFSRVWDAQEERWLLPVKVADSKRPSARDDARSVVHRLGFVPLVWIRNLAGGDMPDGGSTFRPAIETQIEIEYQLSQAGRGLKYSSDPTLLLKEPASSDGSIVRSASSAIVVSAEGDAKMLEIDGTASAAVIEYARALREMALESIHGNRSNADKVSAAQSGRALELLHQPLIQLADGLRASYGEDGLLRLLRMVVQASQVYPLSVFGARVAAMPPGERITLNWAPFFSPTYNDQVEQATALGLAKQAGLMSTETGVKELAPTLDVEDVDAELALIKAEQDAQQQQALALKAAGPKDPGQGSPA